jgi:uncharacterized protein (DUF1330 family)
MKIMTASNCMHKPICLLRQTRPIAAKLLALAFVVGSLTASPVNAESPASEAAKASTPGYIFVVGRTLNRNKIIAYSAVLPPIYADTGGRYLGLGRPGGGVTCLYGHCQGRSTVVAAWANYQQINRFWWGDSYRRAIKLRDASGVFTVVGLKGFPGVMPPAEPGALLIITVAGSEPAPAVEAWLAAATKVGAIQLAPFTTDVLLPLEGDAMYSRIGLLHFSTNAAREAFTASAAHQSLQQVAASSSVLSILAVDEPAAPSAPIPAHSAK